MGADNVLVSLPDLPERQLMGDLPTNVDVILSATTVRAFRLAGDQVRRFAAGEPLVNEVPRYLLT
jgi:hypothetical protein